MKAIKIEKAMIVTETMKSTQVSSDGLQSRTSIAKTVEVNLIGFWSIEVILEYSGRLATFRFSF